MGFYSFPRPLTALLPDPSTSTGHRSDKIQVVWVAGPQAQPVSLHGLSDLISAPPAAQRAALDRGLCEGRPESSTSSSALEQSQTLIGVQEGLGGWVKEPMGRQRSQCLWALFRPVRLTWPVIRPRARAGREPHAWNPQGSTPELGWGDCGILNSEVSRWSLGWERWAPLLRVEAAWSVLPGPLVLWK